MIADRLRNSDTTRSATLSKSRRDVDAIAVDVVAFDDDVAEIDADAEFNAALSWQLRVAILHPALNLDRAGDCVDYAGKFRENTIAGEFDDAALVLGDFACRSNQSASLLTAASVPASSVPISRL